MTKKEKQQQQETAAYLAGVSASAYLASIGSKGGKATGKSKVRGDKAYYQRISKKAAKARKSKAVSASVQREQK